MYIYTAEVDLIIKIHVDISPTLTGIMLLKFVRFGKKKFHYLQKCQNLLFFYEFVVGFNKHLIATFIWHGKLCMK